MEMVKIAVAVLDSLIWIPLNLSYRYVILLIRNLCLYGTVFHENGFLSILICTTHLSCWILMAILMIFLSKFNALAYVLCYIMSTCSLYSLFDVFHITQVLT